MNIWIWIIEAIACALLFVFWLRSVAARAKLSSLLETEIKSFRQQQDRAETFLAERNEAYDSMRRLGVEVAEAKARAQELEREQATYKALDATRVTRIQELERAAVAAEKHVDTRILGLQNSLAAEKEDAIHLSGLLGFAEKQRDDLKVCVERLEAELAAQTLSRSRRIQELEQKLTAAQWKQQELQQANAVREAKKPAAKRPAAKRKARK